MTPQGEPREWYADVVRVLVQVCGYSAPEAALNDKDDQKERTRTV